MCLCGNKNLSNTVVCKDLTQQVCNQSGLAGARGTLQGKNGSCSPNIVEGMRFRLVHFVAVDCHRQFTVTGVDEHRVGRSDGLQKIAVIFKSVNSAPTPSNEADLAE